MFSRPPIIAAALIAGIGLGPAAHAQNPQAAAPGQTPPPLSPAGPTSTPPEQIAPKSGTATMNSGNTLSNALSQSNGTIMPPAVDPNITKSPPARTAGSMPVIPPPGTAGGNTKVVPK
jgi:hypothetical protein